MNAEELADALDAWAAWWVAYGARGYVGAVLPPIRRTARALPHRDGLARATFRRRRRAPAAGNLSLPLG